MNATVHDDEGLNVMTYNRWLELGSKITVLIKLDDLISLIGTKKPQSVKERVIYLTILENRLRHNKCSLT